MLSAVHDRLLPKVTANDLVLMVSLCYLSGDFWQDRGLFASCRKPVHLWLLVSYAMIVASRIIYVAGNVMQKVDSGEFLLNLRHKGVSSQLSRGMWLLLAPAFSVWTVLGSWWLGVNQYEIPDCLGITGHLYIVLLWQLLSYGWIIIHIGLAATAWALELRVRQAEAALRRVEDEDTRSRWGSVSSLSGYASFQDTQVGLSPEAIAELSLDAVPAESDLACSICLSPLECHEVARCLPSCRHFFHRSCIDLWLLRSADCPICKEKVLPPAAAAGDLTRREETATARLRG